MKKNVFGRAICALGLTVAALAGPTWAGEPNAQRVSHFVGAAGESVSIQVPPFHGIEPKLGLSYSSEARNGFAGMGWSLTGVSMIERANGAYGFPQQNETDTFLLDGQPMLKCQPESWYPSCATGGTHYTLQESYLRIKQVSDVKWEVNGKDGTRTEFEPIHTVAGVPTLRLGQRKVVDTHGNEVIYNWDINAGANGNTYVSSITYNGYTIEFFREARPDVITHPGFTDVARQGERLKSIVLRRGAAPAGLIRGYKLSYQTSATTGKSLLASVQMYGKSLSIVDGTITGGPSLPAQTFSYQTDGATGTLTGDVHIVAPNSPTVRIKSAITGKYWSADGGGGGSIHVDRTTASSWETFQLAPLANGHNAIRTINGGFVMASNGGEARSWRARRRPRAGRTSLWSTRGTAKPPSEPPPATIYATT
jgi:hypothetical protein